MSAAIKFAMNEHVIRFADLMPRVELSSGGARDWDGGLVDILEDATLCMRGLRCIGARVPAPCVSDAPEVLFVHTGRWRVRFGPDGEEWSEEIIPGDLLSVPADTFRSFERTDAGMGFLLMMRGPADVVSAPASRAVFEPLEEAERASRASRYWIDTSGGSARLSQPPQRPSELPWSGVGPAANRRFMGPLSAAAIDPLATSSFVGRGVGETCLVGSQTDALQLGALPSWCRDLNLRMLTLASGAYVPLHTRADPEALFVQHGAVEIRSEEGAFLMGAGDTLSVPTGRAHSLRNTTSGQAQVLILLGAGDPSKPVFLSVPPHG